MKLSEAINEVMRVNKQQVFNLLYTTNVTAFVDVLETIQEGKDEKTYIEMYGHTSLEELYSDSYSYEGDELRKIVGYTHLVFQLFKSEDCLVMDIDSASFTNLDITKWKYATSLEAEENNYIVFTNEPYFAR